MIIINAVNLADEYFVLWASYIMTWVLLAIVGVRKIGLLIFKFKDVVRDAENWVDVLMCFLVLGTQIVSQIDSVVFTHIGSCSIITVWMMMTFLIGKYYTLGVYIYMSSCILINLAMFFALYMTTLWGKICGYK